MFDNAYTQRAGQSGMAAISDGVKELADAMAVSFQTAGDFDVFVASLRTADWFTATVHQPHITKCLKWHVPG